MADKDKGDEVTGETTSALTRADFLNELEAVPTVGPDSGAPVVEELPGFGTTGGETGSQRRIALPAGSACHVGGPTSR